MLGTNKKLIIALAEKVLAGGSITKIEAEQLIQVEDQDTMLLLAMADAIRQQYNGDYVDCCAIINGRSGRCSEDCKFCAQSAHYQTGVQEYSLLTQEEFIAAAKKAKAAGAVRFSIVTSGKSTAQQEEFVKICAALKAVKQETGLEVCCSLGLLTLEQGRALRAAGVARFHSNLETAPSYFPSVCSTHSFQDKIMSLHNAKEAGLRVCSGGILGLGETPLQRVELAFVLKELQVDSIPLNILNPIPGTPFAKNKPLPPWEILRAFAVFRFVLPQAQIRTAGGREVNLRDLQALALAGGLNGLMIGGYLTTDGRSPQTDRQLLRDLGRRQNLDSPVDL